MERMQEDLVLNLYSNRIGHLLHVILEAYCLQRASPCCLAAASSFPDKKSWGLWLSLAAGVSCCILFTTW